jgi:integrase
MPRELERLSALAVKRAKKGDRLHDGGGLYLMVDQSGNRSWAFRYGASGRSWHGLGPLHTVTLAQAREKAKACRELLLEGKDPIAEKRARKAAAAAAQAKEITFAAATAKYISNHHAGWKNPKNRQQWENTLATYAAPVIGRLPVAAIDTPLVMRVLEPIWRTKTETASRVRMRIERILAWATVHGYRSGDNPARWQNHLDQLLPAQGKVAPVKHHAALPYAEVPGFVAELRERNGAAQAFEFLILTAARTDEVLGATWDEFDLDLGLWTVPPERMKGARRHRVPLSERAIELLRAQPRNRKRPFPFSNMAFLQTLKRMGRADITAHGFRSSFRDWAGDCTAFPRDVAEAALAHAVEDKTEAAYRRADALDKRRKLMAAWADFCAGVDHA